MRSGQQLGTITVVVARSNVTRIDVSWVAYTAGGNSCPARSGSFTTNISIHRCRSDSHSCTPGSTCCANPNFFVIDTMQHSDMGIGGNGEFTSSSRLDGIVHPQPIGPGLGVCGIYNIPYSATRR